MLAVGRFDSGYVQKGYDDPPIGITLSDEDRALEQGGQSAVRDFVTITAAQPNAERLKGLLMQQVFKFLTDHTYNLLCVPWM